jgi:hypothetical protein
MKSARGSCWQPENPYIHDEEDIRRLVDNLRPVLAARDPQVVGIVLGELVAIFIAGHHPSMRESAKQMMFDYITDLLPAVLEEIIDQGLAPEAWRPH